MLRLRLQIEIIGDNGVAWSRHSDIIEGEDAEATRKMVNDLSDIKMFSFPYNGKLVFLNKVSLDRAVITVEELDEAST